MRFFRESGPCDGKGSADLFGWTKRLDHPEPRELESDIERIFH